MSYYFAALALLLTISIVLLVHTLKSSLKNQANVAQEFRSEINKLLLMLSIFTLTYAFRFLGDYFIVPLALSE